MFFVCECACVCVLALLEGGLERFRLSAAVSGHHSALQCGSTRGSLVETEGAEWRRARGWKKRERGAVTTWVWQHVLISVWRVLHTQQCTLLSVTQSPHLRGPATVPTSVIVSPFVTLGASTHLNLFAPSSPLNPLCPSIKSCSLSTTHHRFYFPLLYIYPPLHAFLLIISLFHSPAFIFTHFPSHNSSSPSTENHCYLTWSWMQQGKTTVQHIWGISCFLFLFLFLSFISQCFPGLHPMHL